MRRVLIWVGIAGILLTAAAVCAQEPSQAPDSQSKPEASSTNAQQKPEPPAAPQQSTSPQDSQTQNQPQQNTSQQLPENPTPQKEPSGNAIQVVGNMTKQVAKTELIKARDWESGWVAGIYVGKNRKLVPMTRQQREEYYLRQTLTTPEAYAKRAFAALVDQARGVPYQWDDGWAGYGERFASREGQFLTSNSLAALGNAKLGYEVRYDKCKCEGFKHRLRHAIMRNFLTYDRSEVNLRPQLALYGGAFGGGLMVTAWKPGTRSPWANGAWAMLGQAGYGSLVNLITEFSTEINRKQGVRRQPPVSNPVE